MTDTEQADAGQDEQDRDDDRDDDQGSDRGSDQGSDRDDPDEARLEQLQERIDAARGQADEALAGAFPEEEEKFEESGEVGEEDDDQTIAPPG